MIWLDLCWVYLDRHLCSPSDGNRHDNMAYIMGHYAGALMAMPLMRIKECQGKDVESDGFFSVTWRHFIYGAMGILFTFGQQDHGFFVRNLWGHSCDLEGSGNLGWHSWRSQMCLSKYWMEMMHRSSWWLGDGCNHWRLHIIVVLEYLVHWWAEVTMWLDFDAILAGYLRHIMGCVPKEWLDLYDWNMMP